MRSRNKLLTVIAGLALAVVLLVPSLGQAQTPMKPNGWEILADLSGSMDKAWKQGECGKMSKFQAQKQFLQKMNEAIPSQDYNGAFRRFGHKFYIADAEDWSRLEWGPGAYDKAAMAAAIDKQEPTQGITPLGPATVAADAELSTWPGQKSLVILSDFIRSPDFGQPVDEAAKLQEKYGNDICIFTVNFNTATKDVSEGMAAAGTCGKAYDGCTLLSDQNAFDQFICDVFSCGCIDSDGDGVCDDVDKCPNTPAGAPVDERGCWIVAYDAFFDFDKAVVKKQFYPNIEAAANVLKSNPDLYVTLEGNTDSVGSEQYNYGLGLRRAKAVESVLVKHFGVQASRIRVKSWGETKPIATNDTAEGRSRNRRVDLNIWEPGGGN
jgi:OmpA-OmpF porin, OOP family